MQIRGARNSKNGVLLSRARGFETQGGRCVQGGRRLGRTGPGDGGLELILMGVDTDRSIARARAVRIQ